MSPRPAIDLRHATEADQPILVRVVDDWFAGRRVRHLVTRAWLRHFGSTSWLAVAPGGRTIGFLIGFRSADHPEEGVIQLVGVDPNRRRQGIGRTLVDAFVDDAVARGAATISATAWPGEPPAVAFFEAVGFTAQSGPGSRRIHGSTAFPDYEGEGEDRILFVREVRAGG